MSEKLDKLRASLEKEKERRIKINNRIKVEKTCNEIGVAANNMTLNTGHPALRVILK